MSKAILVLAALAFCSATRLDADSGSPPGRVRSLEGGVVLQRASEAETEDAVVNLPFLEGDRVWTDEAGRIELQFADGSLLRVDRRTKLDYTNHQADGSRRDRISLRLWSGTLSLRLRDRDRSPRFAVELPSGVFEAQRSGVYRVDLQSGEARLSVYEGEAIFEADRRIRIRGGERLFVRDGSDPGRPERFDRHEADDFAQWDPGPGDDQAWSEDFLEDLPEDVVPYAGDLAGYGAWSYENELGHIWRPRVTPSWRPYWSGRWVWTAYGWTWIPTEPWGWAPFHYGRWGFSTHLGWYWIPGDVWGPAWVSWALGSDSVGWCALDRRDRPVLIFETSHGGRAASRSSSPGASPWAFVKQNELATRDLARRRFEPTTSHLAGARILEPQSISLTRDLRMTESDRAIPRSIRTKPGPGDTVPELRSDPMTTIPRAQPRRRYESEEERRRNEDATWAQPAKENRSPHGSDAREEGSAARQRSDERHPRPARAVPENKESKEPPSPPQAAPRDNSARPGAHENSDREVLRPLFDPLSRPTPKETGGGKTERPSGTSSTASPHPGGDHAVRRPQKDKDKDR